MVPMGSAPAGRRRPLVGDSADTRTARYLSGPRARRSGGPPDDRNRRGRPAAIHSATRLLDAGASRAVVGVRREARRDDQVGDDLAVGLLHAPRSDVQPVTARGVSVARQLAADAPAARPARALSERRAPSDERPVAAPRGCYGSLDGRRYIRRRDTAPRGERPLLGIEAPNSLNRSSELALDLRRVGLAREGKTFGEFEHPLHTRVPLSPKANLEKVVHVTGRRGASCRDMRRSAPPRSARREGV